MKDLQRASSWCRFAFSRVCTFWVRFYSAETLPTSSLNPNESLFRRISRAGNPKISMAAVLDQWLEEGRDVKQCQLQRIVKQLRSYHRFRHALQVSEWMIDQRNHKLSPGDIAVQLDLISKVHGLEQAEKHFNSISEDLRVFQVYGAILNCYAQNKSLEKAEATMQKMRNLGSGKTSLSYNAMLNLYFKLGKYEKLGILVEEMEEKGIICDKFTYNIRLNAYGAMSDFEGMEKLLMKMESNPHVTMDWHAYIVVANWYMKTGLTEKSLAMLKRSEQIISGKTKHRAYEIFLTLYATAGNKDEVYRIWKLHKNLGKVYNSGYLCIISSLMKLNDVDGAERILEEWENKYAVYDSRVPNCMISAYCQKGLLKKAEAYVNRLIESGKKLEATTWDRLATGYHVNDRMEKCVETLKRAILASQPGWMPNRLTIVGSIKYLRHQGNVEVAEELLKLLGERGHSPQLFMIN